MLLACVLFALVTVGLVIPCLIDVALTPPWEVRCLTRRTWSTIVIFGSVFGATAWLAVGRPRATRWRAQSWRARPWPGHLAGTKRLSPQDALRRHPAWRAVEADAGLRAADEYQMDGYRPGPTGPDDDPAFLAELERRIRGGREADN